MRFVYFSTAFIAIGFVLVSCTAAPQAPVSVPVGDKNEAMGAVSINDQTPKTTDSLEVLQTGTGMVDVTGKVTRLSTILFGDEKAPRLIAYFDYDCVYCRRFAQTDRPWIIAEYATSGRLAVEMFAADLTPLGRRLNVAAYCSARQGKFAEMDALLLTRPPADQKGIDDAAKKLKLKTADFAACLKSADNMTEPGAERVPTFELNGKKWVGLLSREELKKTIDEALKQ